MFCLSADLVVSAVSSLLLNAIISAAHGETPQNVHTRLLMECYVLCRESNYRAEDMYV